MSRMKPYYEHAGITIYHGDCREVLPSLQENSSDIVLTDPPYPGLKGGLTVNNSNLGTVSHATVTIGTPWGEDLSALKDAFRVARLGMFVFCSYACAALVPGVVGAPPYSLVTWYKRNAMPPVNNVPWFECEFVWAFKKATGLDWRKLRGFYDVPMPQAGCMAKERICAAGSGRAAHPAQKPIALIDRLLLVGGRSVLDCYAGTGTTLCAAKKAGMTGLGIEIEERCCEIAAKRLSQEVLDFSEAISA